MQKNLQVYKSSAGSGKTFTLVRFYLQLALKGNTDYRHILAVTFTNKAANEMKQRVLKALLHLSDPQLYEKSATVKFLLPELIDNTGLDEKTIAGRSKEILVHILHHYDDFGIRTIDSFVSRLIRTFAHELKLPGDFTIELDEDELLDDAIRNLIAKIGVDKGLSDILIEFSLSRAEDEKSWNIENELMKTGKELFRESALPFLDRLKNVKPQTVLEAVRKIRKNKKIFENEVAKRSSELLEPFKAHAIPYDSFSFGKTGVGASLKKFSEGVIDWPKQRVIDVANSGKWFPAAADKELIAAFSAIKEISGSKLNELVAVIENQWPEYNLLKLIEKNLYQLGVLGAIEAEIDLIRQENRIIHISEFNKRISDIIVNEPVPFIYERTGERYRNYLFDEFQDTSRLQWQNFLPLLTDSLATGNLNLIVGDGKQAIYRFRNGKVDQFIMLPHLPQDFPKNVFEDAGQSLEYNFAENVLTSNFRSLSNIVDFNNTLYSRMADKLGSFAEVYNTVEQKSLESKRGGKVSVNFFEKENEELAFEEWNCVKTAEIIIELVNVNYALSEIAVLVRTNKQGKQLAGFLSQNNIKVTSAEALLIADAYSVNTMVSFLRFIQNPDDRIARAAIVKHLYYLNSDKLKSLNEALFVVNVNEDYYAFLKKYSLLPDLKYLRELPLYDLSEELVRVTQFNRNEYDSNLQFFLEFVNTCVKNGDDELSAFLQKYDEKAGNLSVVAPDAMDAVKILTIHKAKGLEFPVVIWPFVSDNPGGKQKNLWAEVAHPDLEELPVSYLPFNKELEVAGFSELYRAEQNIDMLDNVNVTYVATTRAIEQLYILAKNPPKSSDNLSFTRELQLLINENPADWSKENGRFVFGEKEIKHVKAEEVSASEKGMEHLNSTTWRNRIRIAGSVPEEWNVFAPEKAVQYGTLFHDIMSRISRKKEILPVLQSFLEAGAISEEQFILLETRISAIYDHPQLIDLFDDKNRIDSEAPIILPSGDLYRPDKIIFCESKTVILEFKTGSPKIFHREQLSNYISLLKQMCYQNVSGFLIYSEDKTDVVEV